MLAGISSPNGRWSWQATALPPALVTSRVEPRWSAVRYSVPEVLGAGKGYEVRSEGDFDQALASALADPRQMHLLHVHLGSNDYSPTLVRLMTKLRARV